MLNELYEGRSISNEKNTEATSTLSQFRLSARLSLWISQKTVEVRITQFSPYSSHIPLVFGGYVSSRNSDGIPVRGRRTRVGGTNKLFSIVMRQYLEHVRIYVHGPTLLLMTNRKLHIGFWLASRSINRTLAAVWTVEEMCLKMSLEGVQRSRRADSQWQIVPYTRCSNSECSVASGDLGWPWTAISSTFIRIMACHYTYTVAEPSLTWTV